MCPGFEAIFAIAGLLAIAYLVLRRRIPKQPCSVLLVAIMLASVFIPISIAESATALAASSELIAGVVIVAIVGMAIITSITVWIAMRLKKAGPGSWPHPVSITTILAVLFAMNSRYPIIKSLVKISPQNLIKCNGSPRGL